MRVAKMNNVVPVPAFQVETPENYDAATIYLNVLFYFIFLAKAGIRAKGTKIHFCSDMEIERLFQTLIHVYSSSAA